MRIPQIEALSFYSVETSYEVSYMKVQLTRKIRLDSFNDFAENYLYEINWVSDESGFKQ